MKKILIVLLVLLLSCGYVHSQCTVTSTDGYVVHLNLNITSLVVHTNPCPSGFNFDYIINYNITFTGSNIPGNLWTLQGNVLASGYPNNFYDLPNNGGSGNSTSGGNNWTTNTNCNTAQLSNFNPSLQVIIQGPGIPYQVITCPGISLGLHDNKPTIEDSTLDYFVKFFPNPANNLIKVKGYFPTDDEVTIELYDLQWNLIEVYRIEPKDGLINDTHLIAYLSSGIYFIKITQSNYIQEYHKLIIAH